MRRHYIIFILSIIFLQLSAEGLVFFYSRNPVRDKRFDYIFLLGIKGDLGREHMFDCAKLAAEARKLWPEAKLVITGNEEYQEVTDLKKAVVADGVSPEGIIEETQSQDTWDNIGLSQKLIPPDARVLIVTSEFHQRRSLAIAEVLGIRASIYGQDPRFYVTTPYYYIRERGANVVWLFLFLKHML